MNTLIKAIVLSVSASVMAASAFAAPQDNHNQPKHVEQHQVDQHKKQPVVQKAQAQKHTVKPSRDWKAGQVIPSQYRKGQSVDHKKYSKLNKPAKNQQWVKVNSDYVLINTVDHKIVKIIKD
ncbi:RcnB family protein [Acinetobacter soli]|uniref:RcnB family protein n=2 Tax=Acinetobacter soli TaxID=487316 RepID=UPI00125D1BE8|nr:RcnB family protein [Acinetobacter soli]